MFIQCSDCDYKYLVNSADLKPEGRMVECANCNHRWFQEPIQENELLSSSDSNIFTEGDSRNKINTNDDKDLSSEQIKNLPSTVVKEQKVSIVNTFLVIILLVLFFLLFLAFRSYGTNIFVIINFYINEFFFNLKLIIDDLAKIIYQILN